MGPGVSVYMMTREISYPCSGWNIQLLASLERRIRDLAIPAHNETMILTDYEVLLEYPNYVDFVGLFTA
jgi:hypothetical protein